MSNINEISTWMKSMKKNKHSKGQKQNFCKRLLGSQVNMVIREVKFKEVIFKQRPYGR